MSSYNVDSYLDDPKDDVVKLAVSFAQLPDGTSYPQQTLLDATGKKIEVQAMNFYRFSDGQIVEERGQPDLLGLLQQIGPVPG